jgi:hypothetical protein
MPGVGSAPLAMQWAITIWMAGGATALGLLLVHGKNTRPVPAPVPMRILDGDQAPRLTVHSGGGHGSPYETPAPTLRVLPGGAERTRYDRAV